MLLHKNAAAIFASIELLSKFNFKHYVDIPLLYMFSLTLTAIAHDPEFKDVQDWAVAPSSSTNPPQIMEELKEHVRCMMYG